MGLIILLSSIAVAVGLCVIVLAARARLRQQESAPDWWPQFEREFRAYAERVAGHAKGPADRGRQRRASG